MSKICSSDLFSGLSLYDVSLLSHCSAHSNAWHALFLLSDSSVSSFLFVLTGPEVNDGPDVKRSASALSYITLLRPFARQRRRARRERRQRAVNTIQPYLPQAAAIATNVVVVMAPGCYATN